MIGRRVVRWMGRGVVYWKLVGVRRRPNMVLWLLGLHRRPSVSSKLGREHPNAERIDYVVVGPVAAAVGLYHIHAAGGPQKEPVGPAVELHHKKKGCVGCWAVRVGLADCIGPDEWSEGLFGLPLLFDWLDAKRTVGDDELLKKSVEELESLLNDGSFRSNMKVVVVVVVVCLPRPWMPNGDIGGGRVRLDVGSGEKEEEDERLRRFLRRERL
ncbi:hypothetical protein Tco_1017902 [Tanacetum coccineum]|uniref:Uncharacterized protein n=1 Tax=Tanacetum coccineum TaxID=301880 RepID=A0ABQ5FST2_9ASTR